MMPQTRQQRASQKALASNRCSGKCQSSGFRPETIAKDRRTRLYPVGCQTSHLPLDCTTNQEHSHNPSTTKSSHLWCRRQHKLRVLSLALLLLLLLLLGPAMFFHVLPNMYAAGGCTLSSVSIHANSQHADKPT